MNAEESLTNEIRGSEAYQIYRRIMYLREVFNIFSDNYDEMKKMLEELKKKEIYIKLIPLDRRREMQHVLRHIIRRLLNFVASAMMLVDHTRATISDYYQGTEFEEKYNSRKDTTFVDNPLHSFIQGLRNYSLHYQLPLANARFEAYREKLDQPFSERLSFVLIRDQLLTWQGWNSRTREYLNSVDKEIDISGLIDSYFQLVYSFHDWMHSELQIYHSNELKWLNEKINELKDL